MVESRWVKVGEINTHYLMGGEGASLVLLHGGASGAEDEWGPNLEPLAQHHRIYAPDMVGYGKSDKPRLRYTPSLFSDFFENFMEALNLENASIMGHSLGGGIALAFTLNHPKKVDKLILVDSAGLAEKLGLLGRLLVPIFAIKAKLRKDETYLSLMRDGGKEPGDVFLDRLPEITAPTLILWGEWDGYLPVKLAYQAHERLRDSQLHVFKRCWHAPQRERTEEFNQLVLDFLREE
ncbi:MAG: hypothetical protein COS88_05870 [Chloroflexi bacterium CG07_land_8_20_14_0_80_51_10]|nr:MAG: hypothetical protein COS88_05870 [Chloroflexi bacterium CG07_land_8_20_14_0_80_51_10]